MKALCRSTALTCSNSTMQVLSAASARSGSVPRFTVRSSAFRDTEDENMKTSDASQDQSASELISKRIAELGDWRGNTLSRMRKLIKDADPDVVEEWKWKGTPVWSHHGIICTGESYKNVVKLTFRQGRVSEGSSPSLQL